MGRVETIGVVASLYTETLYFYRDVMDFEVVHDNEGYTLLDAGGVQIAVHPDTSDNPLSPTGHGFYLSVQVDNLEIIQRNLQKSGFGLLNEGQSDDRDFILTTDPEGNRLEIYQLRVTGGAD